MSGTPIKIEEKKEEKKGKGKKAPPPPPPLQVFALSWQGGLRKI